MPSGRHAGAIVVAMPLLVACFFQLRLLFAQERVLELGPEIELPGAPDECCEGDGPSVAWDGTAFVLLWHEYRGGDEDLPVSEHLMGARLGSDGSWVDGATELAIGCAVPGYVACDGRERCAFSCMSPVLDDPTSHWLALTQRLEPVWSTRLDGGWGAVAWDGAAFVVVHRSRDATVPLTYLDPDAPALTRELDLPPLPEEYVPARCWPFPAGGELLVFCFGGSGRDARAAVIRIGAGGKMGEWQELPMVPLTLWAEPVGDSLVDAWVDFRDEDWVLRLGSLDDHGLSTEASIGSMVTWAKVVTLGQGAAVAFMSEQGPRPALPGAALSLTALAGYQPSVVTTVARDLPYPGYLLPGAGTDVASSGDTIAVVYERLDERDSPIRIRLATGALEGRGSACGDELECASGFCVDSVCCESACREPCAACNLEGELGLCRPEPLREAEICDELSVRGGGCGCRVSGGPGERTSVAITGVAVIIFASAVRPRTRARRRSCSPRRAGGGARGGDDDDLGADGDADADGDANADGDARRSCAVWTPTDSRPTRAPPRSEIARSTARVRSGRRPLADFPCSVCGMTCGVTTSSLVIHRRTGPRVGHGITAVVNGSSGTAASASLVSCSSSTSGRARSSHHATFSSRALSEFTFQVAIRMRVTSRGGS